jgi:hypothetical protein
LIERADGVVVAVTESLHHRRIDTSVWHESIVADDDSRE